MAGLTIALAIGGWLPVAGALDFGGDCCADLEERIAELEATTARKSNRKVSVTLTGLVNEGVMYWDDGGETDTSVVNVSNDESNFSITGDARISSDLSAGYSMIFRIEGALSGAVTQADDDAGQSGDTGILVWEHYLYLEHRKLGRLGVGLQPRATDGVPEVDLSKAGIAAYAGAQDIGGGLALRRANGALVAIGWADIFNHYNGDPADTIRWDSPQIAGFTVSASWGEDDIWDVAGVFAAEAGGFKVEAAAGYTSVYDTDSEFAELRHDIVVGSASLLHVASGLNATIAAAQQSFREDTADEFGVRRRPSDASFIYGKLGWLANLNKLGATAFYGEYGVFWDLFTTTPDPAGVGTSLSASGAAARIAGNEATVWGLGLVQHIDAAAMQLYAGYRNHAAEFDLKDAAGNKVATSSIKDMHTLIVGGAIAF